MRLEGDWERDGFVIARSVYSPATVARLRIIAERCLARWCCEDFTSRGVSVPSGTADERGPRDPTTVRGAHSLRHLNHPGFHAPGSPEFATLMEAIAEPAILALVESMLQSPPVFRVSTLFFQPTPEHGADAGHDGAWHRDCKFLIPDESDERAFLDKHISEGHTNRRGVAMQIALVANDDFELVRGSHARYDSAEEYAVRLADGGAHSTDEMPGAVRIVLEPGDGVLFNS